MEGRTNVYETITAKIVSILEAGKATGTVSWRGQGDVGRMPYNFKTGQPYSGVNVLSLWVTANERAYPVPAWLTFKQAVEMGGNVRKGEKSTLGIYYDTYEKTEQGNAGEEETRSVRFAKAFHLFNLAQVEGIATPEPAASWDPLSRAEAVIKGCGAQILEGGTRAFYNPVRDFVRLPDRGRFLCPENFYVVTFHELGHWTGHKARLARDLANRFGSDAYAMEELVAELASSFLSAETGVDGKLEHHANYLESWLRVLKKDQRAIAVAAAAASRASAFVLSAPKERTA